MENINVQAVNIPHTTELPKITAETTLGELMTFLGMELGQKREEKTPKRATLLAEGGEPIADICGIRVFQKGFALYENGLGKYSVIWLPYCTRFTYYFNKLRDAEKDYLSETKELPSDKIVSWAWTVVVALFGEERITQKLNRGFGNADISVEGDVNEDEYDPEPEDVDLEGDFVWDDETLGVDPLDAVIRRETREEMLAAMTEKQREVFVLYHKYGWTQEKIAAKLGISQQAVTKLLAKANLKARKLF